MKIESGVVVEIIKRHIENACEYISEEEKYELKVVFSDVLFEIADYMIEESEKLHGKVEIS
jgi:hypothetical protein